MSTYRDFIQNKDYAVTLPSGYKAKIRRPNGFWFAAKFGNLPVGTPADLKEAASTTTPDPTTTKNETDLSKEMYREFVLDPKVRDNPNAEAGEIGFEELDSEDAAFITKYLTGQVNANGEDTAFFSKATGSSQ